MVLNISLLGLLEAAAVALGAYACGHRKGYRRGWIERGRSRWGVR